MLMEFGAGSCDAKTYGVFLCKIDFWQRESDRNENGPGDKPEPSIAAGDLLELTQPVAACFMATIFSATAPAGRNEKNFSASALVAKPR